MTAISYSYLKLEAHGPMGAVYEGKTNKFSDEETKLCSQTPLCSGSFFQSPSEVLREGL